MLTIAELINEQGVERRLHRGTLEECKRETRYWLGMIAGGHSPAFGCVFLSVIRITSDRDMVVLATDALDILSIGYASEVRQIAQQLYDYTRFWGN